MSSSIIQRESSSLFAAKQEERIAEAKRRRKFLVTGIWLYFFLLIFEGALRKWVLPSLANPLLIVRDPVAIYLMLYAWYYNMFPRSIFIIWMSIVTIISIFTTLFFAHGNLVITIYGARTFLIHFPFVFLIGSVLNRSDVLKVGKVALWISIPMAIMVAIQFYSPQSAWVNRGVGGDMSGAGFGGALGYFRPPGTFSFTNGLVAFFSFTAAYIFYFWLRPGQINKVILISATIGLIFTIPFSISRTLAFTVSLMILFVLMTLSRNIKNMGRILVGLIGIGVLIVLLSKTGWLDTPMEVFLSRFEQAGKTEGGVEGTLGNRYFGGMLKAILKASEKPFFGEGLGLGTNAGAALFGSKGVFLVAEEEWARTIGEMGALLGMAVILIRLSVTFKLAVASYFEISVGYVLPWMLLSFCIIIFPQGAWAQPTMLGFSTMITGLLIASLSESPETKTDTSSITEGKVKTPALT